MEAVLASWTGDQASHSPVHSTALAPFNFRKTERGKDTVKDYFEVSG
jgi:hypothetical protein